MNVMNQLPIQREFHHDNNPRMNQQTLHESYPPQINQPNNQRPIRLNPASNHIIPRNNNNDHPAINDGYDNFGQFNRPYFDNDPRYLNPQNHTHFGPSMNYPHH